MGNQKVCYHKQFGFPPNHSNAILSIIDSIQQAIDSHEFSCGVFLDISKAFDTPDHNILIEKLDNYGIRGVPKDWFISFLSNRRQHVSLGRIDSVLCPVSWPGIHRRLHAKQIHSFSFQRRHFVSLFLKLLPGGLCWILYMLFKHTISARNFTMNHWSYRGGEW